MCRVSLTQNYRQSPPFSHREKKREKNEKFKNSGNRFNSLIFPDRLGVSEIIKWAAGWTCGGIWGGCQQRKRNVLDCVRNGIGNEYRMGDWGGTDEMERKHEFANAQTRVVRYIADFSFVPFGTCIHPFYDTLLFANFYLLRISTECFGSRMFFLVFYTIPATLCRICIHSSEQADVKMSEC